MAPITRRHAVPEDILARELADPASRVARRRVINGPREQVTVFRDPYDAPIPEAEEFTLNSGAIASVGAGTPVTTALDLQLAAGMVARIASVTIYITDLLATTNVQYTLLAGGAPIHPALSFFPRAATSAADQYDVYKRIGKARKIGMKIQNVDGGTYTVGAIITGWFWNAADGERWITGGTG